jgi:seryl-tRNA synthetase
MSSNEYPAQVVALTFEPAVPIPDHLTGEIQSRLAYVDESIKGAQVSKDRIELQIQLEIDPRRAAGSDERRSEIETKVQRVVLSMAKGAIQPKIQVLEDHLDRPTFYQKDPMEELIARGEVHEEISGVYTLGPLLTRLIAYFEKQFVELANSFEAQPYRFPTLIPASYLERVNYFRAFPHSLSFATHLREDLDAIDHFAEHAHCDDRGLIASPESFAQIQTLLSPAVCYHLYFSLADRPLHNDKLIATAVGNCFRYEATNLTSLERMWNFTMYEVIFVGAKDFVLANREVGRQRMSQFFEKIDLSYSVLSANDPFFIGEFRKQAAFQSAFQLKFEIRARLPFKDSTLAVGSYNYHQDFFGRSLAINLSDGSYAHTGCVAFGMERMAYAFLSQFGFDTGRWPAEVRAFVEN